MNHSYNYIVCGAGSAGCVLARDLSDNPDVSVLVLEAGGNDELDSVENPLLWSENIGSPRDWQFMTEANHHLNGRKILSSMGKILGGGSSINALQWARGHKNDWDYFARVTGDAQWGFDAVRKLYEAIERRPEQQAQPTTSAHNPTILLQPASSETGDVPLLVQAAQSIGIPVFDTPNGTMLEGDGGASTMDTIVNAGKRQSIYRRFLYPVRYRPNLTIAAETLVTRLLIERGRAVGVEIRDSEGPKKVHATEEIILCLGAVNTPKVLMQSGIGPSEELRRFDIPVQQHLPGVGQNFQDHPLVFGCVWHFERKGIAPNASRAVLQWKGRHADATPNLQVNQSNGGTLKTEMSHLGLTAEQWWSLAPALIQPKSRGYLRLTGADPDNPVQVFGNYLAEPDDLESLLESIELCRELASSNALANSIGPELLPGSTRKSDVADFVRQRMGTFWHQSCTAKMGNDEASVVNARLQVYGVDRLRIADASVLPRIPAANTMAPCLIIGLRASQSIRATWTSSAGIN